MLTGVDPRRGAPLLPPVQVGGRRTPCRCAEAVLRFRALYPADEADGGLARRERACAIASGLAGWCLSKLPKAMLGLKAQAALRCCAEHCPRWPSAAATPACPSTTTCWNAGAKRLRPGARTGRSATPWPARKPRPACTRCRDDQDQRPGDARLAGVGVRGDIPLRRAAGGRTGGGEVPWSPDVPDRRRVKN